MTTYQRFAKQELGKNNIARTELDDFGITRKHPPLACAEGRQADAREAFANLAPKDFDPRAETASKEDITEISRAISELCGLDWTACLPDSRIRIKANARYVLHNVTKAEVYAAIEKLRESMNSWTWWREHGRPGAAARCIVDEVSRMRTARDKSNGKAVASWLDPTETPEAEARRVKAALSWKE